MSGYEFDFSYLAPFKDAFISGAYVAVIISVSSFVIGTVIGILLTPAFMIRGFSSLLIFVNDFVRALPPLVLILALYFFPWKQISIEPPNPIIIVIAAMAIAQAAYTADLCLYALGNINPSLLEASRALGFRETEIWWRFLIPDILRQTLPAQLAFFIGIVRLSSLGAVIGAPEVAYVAQVAIAGSYRAIEAWIVVALIYSALVIPVTTIARIIERTDWLRRKF